MDNNIQQASMITGAIQKRIDSNLLRLSDGSAAAEYTGACRLFNGFTEGDKSLAIDLFGSTVVIHDYGTKLSVKSLTDMLRQELPFIRAVLWKKRNGSNKNGILLHGGQDDLCSQICEHGVNYAIDLTLNQDCGFYSDTRHLRRYLLENAAGKTVLNTFAYTGSLGVAAFAGSGEHVVQTDLSDRFLALADRSYPLNSVGNAGTDERGTVEHVAGDFFPVTAAMRKAQREFDIVILDPPYFAETSKGTVDLVRNPLGVIRKVRPLVSDGGILIAVNNALRLSGRDFLTAVDSVCDGHYLCREQIIEIPDDFTGYNTADDVWQISPYPFNHPTKIVVLRCRRKNKSF